MFLFYDSFDSKNCSFFSSSTTMSNYCFHFITSCVIYSDLNRNIDIFDRISRCSFISSCSKSGDADVIISLKYLKHSEKAFLKMFLFILRLTTICDFGETATNVLSCWRCLTVHQPPLSFTCCHCCDLG